MQADAPQADRDDAIRAVVVRLSRPHASGGKVVERAAILAEGAHSAAIVQWITDHAGDPRAPRRSPAGDCTALGWATTPRCSGRRRRGTSCRQERCRGRTRRGAASGFVG